MVAGVDKIRCQKCLTANPLTEKLCVRCGTPLMLVVAPQTMRFEVETGDPAVQEEYLLERVAILENRLARITERLEQSLELLLRHARNSYADHMMLQTLVVLLSESGTIDAEQFERTWRARRDLQSSSSPVDEKEQSDGD
jgi:hypothetical protein